MPIRFRCQHCHQLMGIARRKSGTEVQCPTCRHHVVVPIEDEVPAEAEPRPRAAVKGSEAMPDLGGTAPLFERSDFDEVLRGEAPGIVRPSPKIGTPVPRPLADAPVSGVVQAPAGIFLTSKRVTLLTVVGIVLLALAFGAGLLVGRYCL